MREMTGTIWDDWHCDGGLGGVVFWECLLQRRHAPRIVMITQGGMVE